MAGWSIKTSEGCNLAEHVEIADTFWTRFKGLQLRRALPQGHGLLLVPCSSLHTHWLRFQIDMVMISRDATVLDVRRQVQPWRFITAPKHTHAVLEVPADSAEVQVGQHLKIEGGEPGTSPPESVAFLTTDRRSA